MSLIISPKIAAKLSSKERPVSKQEVVEVFANRSGAYLTDDREEHASDPPTLWFVAETDSGRRLKVMFIARDGDIYLRSAYDANAEVTRIYQKYSN